MEVTAKLASARVSPFKARLVLDAIRGRKVSDAIAISQFLPNKSAAMVEQLLRSVSANAENNYDLDPDTLWIKAIFADEAQSLRRFKPRSRGRVGRIKRRSCHITVIAENREGRR